MSLSVISVGNGDDKYPGNFTKKERNLISQNIVGRSLHLFSGRSLIGDVRIDFSCIEADYTCDVFDFLKTHSDEKFDTIILDPPYNERFASNYKKLGNTAEQFIIFANAKKTTELFKLINSFSPKRIILKSWNYYTFSKYGYHDFGSYVCYAGGYRKPTFLMILEKDL